MVRPCCRLCSSWDAALCELLKRVIGLPGAEKIGRARLQELSGDVGPKKDGQLCICIADGSDAGDKVFLEGGEAPAEYAKTLKSEPWKSIVDQLNVQGGKALYEGKLLVTAKGAIKLPLEMPDGAGIH